MSVAETFLSARHLALRKQLKGIQSRAREIPTRIGDKAQETPKYSLPLWAGSDVLPLRDTPFPAAHPFHLPTLQLFQADLL